jgi:TRAP-type C4-dicarboxylate transport system permease large subunit
VTGFSSPDSVMVARISGSTALTLAATGLMEAGRMEREGSRQEPEGR